MYEIGNILNYHHSNEIEDFCNAFNGHVIVSILTKIIKNRRVISDCLPFL